MKILIIMTNADTLTLNDNTKHASGFWASEFVHPYQRFKSEGYKIDIATIDGIAPTTDVTSVDSNFMPYVRPEGSNVDDAQEAEELLDVIKSEPKLKKPLDLAHMTKAKLAKYDGIYYCGGHGSMQDMPKSDSLTQVGRWLLELDKPIAAVCHGGSGLLALRTPEGEWPFKGYRMTCFSHAEEKVTPIYGKLPFVLEEEVTRLGAKYEKADLIWDSHIVEDRNFITGQNPYSSKAIADAFVNKLNNLENGSVKAASKLNAVPA